MTRSCRQMARLQVLLSVIIQMYTSTAVPICPVQLPCTCSWDEWDKAMSIDCANKNLTSIPFIQQTSTDLNIYLWKNKITEIKKNAFSNLSIRKIYLTENNISTIDIDGFTGLENSLEELWLGRNRLTSFPTFSTTFHRFNKIILSSNNIRSLPSDRLTQLPQLSVLDLASNHLRHIDSFAFRGIYDVLGELHLQHNNLDHRVLSAISRLQNLQRLYLSQNNIHVIPNTGFGYAERSLKDLYLEQCHLRHFPSSVFERFNHLKILLLSRNKIQNLQFPVDHRARIYKTMTHLYLRHMNLTSVPSGIANFTRLQTIDLSFNNISTLTNKIFRGSQAAVKQVHLQGNKLRKLNSCTFQNLNNLHLLHLGSNPLSCKCDLAWLKNTSISLNNIQCVDGGGLVHRVTVYLNLVHCTTYTIKETCRLALSQYTTPSNKIVHLPTEQHTIQKSTIRQNTNSISNGKSNTKGDLTKTITSSQSKNKTTSDIDIMSYERVTGVNSPVTGVSQLRMTSEHTDTDQYSTTTITIICVVAVVGVLALGAIIAVIVVLLGWRRQDKAASVNLHNTSDIPIIAV